MKRLSHSQVRLSISLLGAGTLALASHAGQAAAPSGSPYYGRWQVEDAQARFSARGRPYKTIDIAPCGRDFCGVSVDDRGTCGATLFRFLTKHGDGNSRLQGHGAWGTLKKNVTIDYYQTDAAPGKGLELNLGNGWDFGERGGSMPMFNAAYTPRGDAQCRAR